MEELKTKIAAMIGMGFSLISFVLVIVAWFVSMTEAPAPGDVSPSFGFWGCSVMVAYCSMPFYLADAAFCIVKVVEKTHPVIHAILALLLLGAIPMLIFVGGLGVDSLIWNLYYAAIFVLEILSIVKHVKMARANKS